jgi:UDP-N-acetyl-D-galactosamine dehydrogenase
LTNNREKIAVIGLGYVGLPLAIGLSKHFGGMVGFDIDVRRIKELQSGFDRTLEVNSKELCDANLHFTCNPKELAGVSFFIVTVPTPIDANKNPDLSMVIAASRQIASYLSPGAIIVYESTVYPGATEEVCGPVLAEISGLKRGIDFKLAYSPERINPADREHTLERVIKVVSAEDAESLERVVQVYNKVAIAGIHLAPSIKVAEAAKVIENVQRDLNIALMNELAVIFDYMGIRTVDVLAAAGTKWNFLPFVPGLVGGHCIGVDPYYLTAKAESLGYHPEVILAGRRINDAMGTYIAQRTVKLLIKADIGVKHARIGILGLAFKENVPDLRNSRVPDIIRELRSFGIEPLVHDPLVNCEDAQEEYGFSLCDWQELTNLDAMIIAVNHRAYCEKDLSEILGCLRTNAVLVDVKSMLVNCTIPQSLHYWCL